MELIKIGVLGITSAILILVIRNQRPEIGIQISLVFGAMVMIFLASRIKAVLDLIEIYVERANIGGIYITTLFKVIGMAYITEFAAESCRDASQNAIASKIELAGRILIIITAMPVITSVMNIIIGLL
ncbi:stage III sporulation protein AD [Thermoclostridium stercorarium subsp. thermolacticum DSM 2910]|jgi:stage III sporulation protein AD|uniref:Stage III sporulation protein AD n=2 Tax=Thermoclostridium stercorarium TaxID=1510 RepID=A0A1B1YIC9_THEST|nr:stage III sporulation protein AD [Thermoclostridium stercorarium]ANW97980.1 stage III sporulation protein AD [Thermoclostridium stercorarium subsp. thermolacticum DSM 2910]ANX00530.1 stage III sporulation protein AD [Thermoclostridium stercorarium subsp. leptospartum DSM 9219]UZQ86141.1 stage III sporulation protein AD [Thermoclostridium stercorarium]